MKYFAIISAQLMLGLSWLAGIVIAQGFWSTLFTIFVPFYAWYLVIEVLLKKWALI